MPFENAEFGIQVKITPNGLLHIERGDDVSNHALLDALEPYVKNKSEIRNFLLQWEGREVLLGMGDLCG